MIVWRKASSPATKTTLARAGRRESRPNRLTVAHKLDVIDKWGKILTVITVVFGLILGAAYVCTRVGSGRCPSWESNRDEEPGISSSLGLRLGSVLLGLFARGSRRESVRSRRRRTPECTSCHEQGQKLAKSAHAGLHLRYLSRIARQSIPTPPISPNQSAPPATPTRRAITTKGVHGLARKARQRRRARLRPVPRQRPRTAAAEIAGLPQRRCRIPAACATPKWSTNTAPACTARRWRSGITQAPLCTDCHGEHKIIKHTNEASSGECRATSAIPAEAATATSA